MLRKSVFEADQLAAIVSDYHNAGLEPQEVAVMEFAEKLTLHAHTIQKEDVQTLRGHVLSDEEILDVDMAAAMLKFARIALGRISSRKFAPRTAGRNIFVPTATWAGY